MILSFMAYKKNKPNGKTCSHVQIHKYNDAVLWGTSQAHELLPSSYYDEMKNFLDAFKKTAATAKSEGMLDEQEADPINPTFFRCILRWALADRNVFVWVFSLCQWHFMARSISIGVLALHHFDVGEDHGICKFDKSKTDQTGEKAHKKHFYDNPHESLVSIFLALGVWFSLKSSHFEVTENLFQSVNVGTTTASQRYCTQLCELLKNHREAVQTYIRPDHANSHGIRKGSGTHASSGTTAPPPVSSIAARGEWTLGKVLDVYWHFSEPGDTYLGRVLAFLNPSSPEFGTLPPHFNMDDPMSNPLVKEGMLLSFAMILQKWGSVEKVNPTGLLLRCLAAMVWHLPFLIETTRKYPGHPFAALPLLNNAELLQRLKPLVVLDPIGQIQNATGIPPHIEHCILTRDVLETCKRTFDEVQTMTQSVSEAVSEAIEQKAASNGHLTFDHLQGMFESHLASID